MELIYDTTKKDKVFTFDGEIKEQVWEAEPVKLFRFKTPVKNDYIKSLLEKNSPTAGIIFDSKAYIGTSDGRIYTKDNVIERIPEILVDEDLFLEEFHFNDELEKNAFLKYREHGMRSLDFSNRELTERIFKINNMYESVRAQERFLDRYLDGFLRIRGFVTDIKNGETSLFDGHLLGITNTLDGKIINDLTPLYLHQIDEKVAGYIPWGSPIPKRTIKDGFIEDKKGFSIDYISLWSIDGQKRIVKDICPRDGSGCAPANFATDGQIYAISHGNHPYYSLDIYDASQKTQESKDKRIQSIDLDPNKIPSKLLIRNGEVIGLDGENIKNYSTGEVLHSVGNNYISSMNKSGLCTIVDNNKTTVYNFMDRKKIDVLEGKYAFLRADPQR